jgi:Sulfatase
LRRTFLPIVPLFVLLILSCRGKEEAAKPAAVSDHRAHQGPIVLITIDALRADVIGALGGPPKLTPNLDRLASEATWAGRAVSPSSWTVPSMGSLFTGLQPWSTQSWSGDRAVLREQLVTLPEALKARSYRTSAFRSNHWLQQEYGYGQGFDSFRYLREGKRAETELAGLKGGADFVWIHILPPHAPYVRREPLVKQLSEVPPGLPQKIRPLDLEPYFDPDVPLPPEQAKVFKAMYELNAAWADAMLGRMLESLRKSGQWDKTLLVVTADHGEELGECGQIAHGGNLCRQLVEVPLMVKLPKGFDRKLDIGSHPGTIGVRATLIEAAGGEAEPGTAPSLFTKADGVLSELYLGNGVNRFSYVEGDLQVLWESRFSKPEPEYYRARYEGIGGKPEPPLREPSKIVFARLEDAFARTFPLAGAKDAAPQLSLWRWTAQGMERVEDPAETQRMARKLRAAWIAANGPEKAPGRSTVAQPKLTPEEEAEMRALGYAGK